MVVIQTYIYKFSQQQGSIRDNGSIIITLYNIIYISGWLVAVRALNVIGMMLGSGALVFMGLYTFLNSEKYDRMFKTSAMSSAIVAGIYLSTRGIPINLIKITSHIVSTLLICCCEGIGRNHITNRMRVTLCHDLCCSMKMPLPRL